MEKVRSASLLFLLVFVLPLSLTATATAQERDGLVETSADSVDPIGVDASSDLHRLSVTPRGQAPEEIAARGPRPPRVRARAGEILTAPPSVREATHEVSIRLLDGLAYGEVAMQFASRSQHPAEVAYRLAVPQGATLAGLEVCAVDGDVPTCRAGVADTSHFAGAAYDDALRARGPREALPIAHASPLSDERGVAVRVRAAPVPANGELLVRVRWVADAPVAGGVVRMTLPARGTDPRAAPTSIRVDAGELNGPTVDGTPVANGRAVSLDPWFAPEVVARVGPRTGPRARIVRARCGERDCIRAWVRAGVTDAEPRDLVLLVDASPSTEGPARGRIGAAVAALLATAPPGSRIRAVAFAGRARTVVERPVAVDAAPLVPLAQAAYGALGPATRFESAWDRVEPWLAERGGPRPLVVILGDGGISDGPASRAAFTRARRMGVEVASVNVADRSTWPRLREAVEEARGVVVEAGAEAERATRGRTTAPLEERLAAVFATVESRRVTVTGAARASLGALRAGEALSWEAVVPRGARVGLSLPGVRVRAERAEVGEAHARGFSLRTSGVAGWDFGPEALVAVDPADLATAETPGPGCHPLGPPVRAGGVSSDAAPIAQAERRSCGVARTTTSIRQPPPDPRAGRGMPAQTVLNMLRQRLVPHARRCFRRDRAGRADYAVRAEFELHLADRELVRAQVHGRVSDVLRTCLQEGGDRLTIPRFGGTVVVRYPLVTEREAPAPVIELARDVAAEVDRIAPRQSDGAASSPSAETLRTRTPRRLGIPHDSRR